MPCARISAKVWAILIFIVFCTCKSRRRRGDYEIFGAAPNAEAAPFIAILMFPNIKFV